MFASSFIDLIRKTYYQNCQQSIITSNENEFENYLYLRNNVILFISHGGGGAAAKILFELILYMESMYSFNILLIHSEKTEGNIDNYYTDRFKHKPLSYEKDHNQLLKIIQHLNPSCILSNSIGPIIVDLDLFQQYIPITLFYFHETTVMINYISPSVIKNIQSLPKDTLIYVLTGKIKHSFHDRLGLTNIQISSPFISSNSQLIIDEKMKIPLEISLIDFHNKGRIIDWNKVTIIMCGSVEFRKGFDIYVEVSKLCPEFNFIWVGSKILNKIDVSYESDNFFHFPTTENPFKYFVKSDYFFLSSRDEPFSIAVLEAMYLNIPIIVLEENLRFNHTLKNNFYSIQNHEDDSVIISNYFKSINLVKRINGNESSKEYVRNFFTTPQIGK